MESIEFLKTKGVSFRIIRLNEIPKSASDVARLYCCSLSQVLKTLLFIGAAGPVLVILSSDKHVDLNKLERVSSQKNLKLASPLEVKQITGFEIGSVSPFGIKAGVFKILDSKALENKTVNFGSGSADSGIELSSESLRAVWDGIIAEVSI